jgi:hypothetical protein
MENLTSTFRSLQFHQGLDKSQYFICDWWFNFDCSEAAALAESKNAEIAAERSAVDELAAAGSETVEDVQGSYGAPSEDYADEADAGYGAPAEYEARRRF